MNKDFHDFSIGETYNFKRTFTQSDFDKFSSLSGDTNPLHSDDTYAKNTGFKQAIVPLHLAAAPLSAIAGVVFPGDKSLYLGHELKAPNPIPYDIELTYSAKIIEKIERDQILIIRTIIFNTNTIFVEATQRIKVRSDSGKPETSNTDNPLNSTFLLPKQAYLITGAAGEIGRNIALKLAKNGKNLVLNFRKKDSRVDELTKKLTTLGTDFELLELDLSTASNDLLNDKLQSIRLNIGTIIHTACPPVHSPLSNHMKVNFESLALLFSLIRYKWLCQQFGQIIFISSSATLFHPKDWENYIAAKSATENYLKGIQQNYSHYGIKANILSPGRVDTNFSKNLNIEPSDTLLPEQVAEEVISIIENPACFYTWLETNLKRKGTYGFIESTSNTKEPLVKKEPFETSPVNTLIQSLKHFLSKFFKMAGTIEWSSMGINTIPGWDSLRHIELLMELESEFGISVTSAEIDQTTTFTGILRLLEKKRNIH